MSEPHNKKRTCRFISILILVALVVLGYYIDPKCELVQEITGIRFMTNDAHPVVTNLISGGAKDIIDESPEEDDDNEDDDDNEEDADSKHILKTLDIETLRRPIIKANPKFAETQDENGFNTLHEAAAHGHADTVKYLVENAIVDVNARIGLDNDGPNALFLAKQFLDKDHLVIQYLESHGAEALDEDKLAFKDGVIFYPSTLVKVVLSNNREAMLHILKHKPEWVHRRDNNGWNALHEAARAGKPDAVRFLIESGRADVNARTSRDADGGSVLYHALENLGSDHPVVEYLLKTGAKNIAPGDEE